MLAADGPQLVLDGWTVWLTFIGLACGTLVGVAAAWRKVIHPMLKVGAVIEESFPKWVAIAEQYSPEAGGLLTAELAALATGQSAISDTLTDVVGRLEELHRYSHDMNHNIIGDLSRLGLVFGATSTVVDALGRTADRLSEMQQTLDRLGDKPEPTGA